ncbi:MAG TPA: radical SAM protein [Methanocella sp.]|uniref:radical SAM/SPASM domain-containing protein n=1 Tax=Methanocella sp. TaxID=2052833 RepID=UPI002C3BB7BF|nr:radical SAM protein [Methanocella sp.]HTY91577.1 radical SAM protein [Methanocella sp.]
MVDDITTTAVTVNTIQKWLNNPASKGLLSFLCEDDKCGDRLSIAIDSYLGEEVNACWKCKAAGKIVREILNKGGHICNIQDEDIKKTFKQPYFKTGLMNIIRGINEYGVAVPQRIHAPIVVVWDCTHACNLGCKHCYQNAQKKLPDELSTEEAKRMIDDIAEAGSCAIAFSGGEPLMRKDFFELAEYSVKKGLYTALATNGTLITKEMAHRIKEVGVGYVEVSIDGKDSETHDGFRGAPGTFDKVIQGIKNCVDEGLYMTVATTVSKTNVEQIPEIVQLVKSLGVSRIITFNFIPTGRGECMSNMDITPEERESLLRYLSDRNYDSNMEVMSTAPQFGRVSVKREGVNLAHFMTIKKVDNRAMALCEFIGGCAAGRFYCCVRPNGDINPCVFIPIKVGNVRENKLLDTWHNSPVLDTLRDRDQVKGHCATCENKYICGGCRARAYAYFGDLTAADPGCINNMDAWSDVVNKSYEVADKSLEAVNKNSKEITSSS